MTQEQKILGTQTFQKSEGEPLLQRLERKALCLALSRDYEVFLEPGERFDVDAVQGDDFAHVQMFIKSASDSFSLLLEAGMLDSDLEHGEQPRGEEALGLLLEFLRLELYEYFRQDRAHRFALEWKIYEYNHNLIRFRGEVRRPGLEAEADALLQEGSAHS